MRGTAVRRPLARLTVLVVVFSLSGCVFAPSDPKTAPIGVRMDDGVVSILIPECLGGSAGSAYVYDLEAESPDVKLWQASGFIGEPNGPISFSSSSWSSVSGSYESLESFGVMVVTESGEYGWGLYPEYLSSARGLPSGEYLMSGEAVRPAEYFAEAAKYPCPAPAPSTERS